MPGGARIIALGPHDGTTVADAVEGRDEALHVLSGALRIGVGEHVHRAEAGGFLLIPRGTPQRLRNAGPCTPAS